jgi:hypothetical protein
MMLDDQSTSHIPNTIFLKRHRKTQPQGQLSLQAFYTHAYSGEVDYENEEINFDHVKPIYDAFSFVDDANKWSKQVDEDQHDFNDTSDDSSFEDIHEFNQDLKLYKIFANPLFQSK